MIDIKKNVEIGKSLAGLQLGSNLSIFLPYIDTVIDGEDVPWTVMIEQNNNGKLLYKIPDNNGFIVYVNMPKLELGFTEKGNLYYIRAGVGYLGEIFKGVKIGSKISEIKNQLYLDDTEDVMFRFLEFKKNLYRFQDRDFLKLFVRTLIHLLLQFLYFFVC